MYVSCCRSLNLSLVPSTRIRSATTSSSFTSYWMVPLPPILCDTASTFLLWLCRNDGLRIPSIHRPIYPQGIDYSGQCALRSNGIRDFLECCPQSPPLNDSTVAGQYQFHLQQPGQTHSAETRDLIQCSASAMRRVINRQCQLSCSLQVQSALHYGVGPVH